MSVGLFQKGHSERNDLRSFRQRLGLDGGEEVREALVQCWALSGTSTLSSQLAVLPTEARESRVGGRCADWVPTGQEEGTPATRG